MKNRELIAVLDSLPAGTDIALKVTDAGTGDVIMETFDVSVVPTDSGTVCLLAEADVDIDNLLRLLCNKINATQPVKQFNEYGAIVRFEFSEWIDSFKDCASNKYQDLFLQLTQDGDHIHVYADYIRKEDFIEYVCIGNLDEIVRQHLFVRDAWNEGNYDIAGTDIREWETTTFDRSWLQNHCNSEFCEELHDLESGFKLSIVFENGEEFVAKGYSNFNKDFADLMGSVFSDPKMVRLLAAHGFVEEDIFELSQDVVQEDIWNHAKENPLELVALYVDGKRFQC